MAEEAVKLKFLPSSFKVKAEITIAQSRRGRAPMEVIDRVRQKLTAIQSEQKIGNFEIYSERFVNLWNAMAQSEDMAADTIIEVIIGQGIPSIKDLVVEPPRKDKEICQISITGKPEVISSWDLDWVLLTVKFALQKLNIKGEANSAQIEGAWMRAKNGQNISGLGIASAAPKETTPPKEKYKLAANRTRGEAYIQINDISIAKNSTEVNSLLDQIEVSIRKLDDGNTALHLLRTQLTERLRCAWNGPQRFGIDLPLNHLCAIPQSLLNSGSAVADTQNTVIRGDGELNCLNGKIVLRVSQKGMQAIVAHFDPSLYGTENIDWTWFDNVLTKAGVVFGKTQTIQKTLTELILRGRDLNGQIVAEGKLAYAAQGPFLYAVHLDAPGQDHGTDEDENVNIRDAQQRKVVKAGQLVAEIRYKRPEILGRDIFGKIIKPSAPEPIKINFNENIEERQAGRYYARVDGTPRVTRANIQILQTYTHTGDVNLSTGNIYFDGPIKILGSIDRGAVVHTTQDLEVQGSVRSGSIRVGGKLKVEEGIVTGTESCLRVEGELQADFIENSFIECLGDIKVRKNIINSKINCLGSISIRDGNGVVAGGNITCLNDIQTATFGFKSGNVTHVHLGIDFQQQVKLRKFEARLKKVEAIQEDDRAKLREILGRPAAQLTKRHHELKDTYQKKLQKATQLIAKITALQEKFSLSARHNNQAILVAKETLFPNANIMINGRPIPVLKEIAHVVASRKKRRGSHIHPIESFKRENSNNDDSDDDAA